MSWIEQGTDGDWYVQNETATQGGATVTTNSNYFTNGGFKNDAPIVIAIIILVVALYFIFKK